MVILSLNASDDPKAQHEPHEAWSLMGWIYFGHCSLESKADLAWKFSETNGSGKSLSVSWMVPKSPLTYSMVM